jgi:hypothetical protein
METVTLLIVTVTSIIGLVIIRVLFAAREDQHLGELSFDHDVTAELKSAKHANYAYWGGIIGALVFLSMILALEYLSPDYSLGRIAGLLVCVALIHLFASEIWRLVLVSKQGLDHGNVHLAWSEIEALEVRLFSDSIRFKAGDEFIDVRRGSQNIDIMFGLASRHLSSDLTEQLRRLV